MFEKGKGAVAVNIVVIQMGKRTCKVARTPTGRQGSHCRAPRKTGDVVGGVAHTQRMWVRQNHRT